MTISGGSATNDGGALRIPAASDTVLLQDVVITGSSAAAGGGGISLTAGSLTVRNSTISGNVAGINSSLTRRNGGGIFVLSGTLLVENERVNGPAADIGAFEVQEAPALQSIAVTPATPTVAKGQSQQFTATGSYSDGSTQNVTGLVTWASATPAVATISGSGLAAAVATGTSTISATMSGVTGSTVLTVTPSAPVSVQSVVIDNGTAQRSMVRSVTVSFSGLVTFVGPVVNAFQMVRTGSTGNVTLAVDLSGSTAIQTVARLTFSGSYTEAANSLIDGNYTLTVFSAQVQGGLTGGDNLTALHRLYGDVNGDRAVNGLDLTEFRKAFGAASTDATYLAAFDWNGDGTINGPDLTQFRSRFGVILP
ncbi:MAG TPA: Ig-like domain-containing protein [Gemmataceae bacterium]|nr:Ig-like domain-containing protein [Gemmataceae bacterium]